MSGWTSAPAAIECARELGRLVRGDRAGHAEHDQASSQAERRAWRRSCLGPGRLAELLVEAGQAFESQVGIDHVDARDGLRPIRRGEAARQDDLRCADCRRRRARH